MWSGRSLRALSDWSGRCQIPVVPGPPVLDAAALAAVVELVGDDECAARISCSCSRSAVRGAGARARRARPAGRRRSCRRPGSSAGAARRADRGCRPSRRPSAAPRTARSAGCPTASSTRDSGTPVHWPIAVQPSSHVCRVICVRDGSCFSSASENVRGRATRPSTDQPPVGERSGLQPPVLLDRAPTSR